MAFPYKLHSQAIDEYANGYEWYENERYRLGEQFLDVIDRQIADICENPGYYSRLRGSYRQAIVEKFPYVIVYEFFPRRKFIHIAAIFHTSRNPKEKFRKEE